MKGGDAVSSNLDPNLNWGITPFLHFRHRLGWESQTSMMPGELGEEGLHNVFRSGKY
jgi:hypothetical protein